MLIVLVSASHFLDALCADGRGEVGQNLEHAIELFQSGRFDLPMAPLGPRCKAMGVPRTQRGASGRTALGRHAAAQGNTDAAAELGKCYTKGTGCKADEEMGSAMSCACPLNLPPQRECCQCATLRLSVAQHGSGLAWAAPCCE